MENEKLDLSNKRMGKFLISQIFPEIKRGKRLIKSNRINGNVPLVTAGLENNGIADYIGNNNQEMFNKNSISIDMFGNAFIRNYDFHADDNIIIINNKKFNIQVLTYMVTVISKSLKNKYNYGNQYRIKSIDRNPLTLPIKEDGTPDYEWMDQYISQIKKDYITLLKQKKEKEVSSTLKVANIDSYILTEQEKLFLDKWRSGSVKMEQFLVGDLFEIKLSKGDNKLSELHKGSIPLVSAGEKNQGIVGYIDKGDGISEKFNKNTITADMFGNVFLQSKDYYAVSHGRINILIPKNDFNINMLLYFVSIISKCVGNNRYGFSQMLTSRKLKEITFTLPIKEDGTPDYEAMEQYIIIMKKMAVKKLNQKYNDTISKTEEVAKNQ